MERTVWITALALAVTASVSCKDSNPDYISFDAQAPAQTADAKSDLPPPVDGAVNDVAADHGSSSSDATASDLGADHAASSPDAPVGDVPADTTLAQDTASDGTASGADVASDATADDGGDGP